MKRKLLILSLLVICIATFAAGSLAYFTYEGKAHNVISTGSVEIEVLEWADTEKKTPFENLKGVMPGTAVTKIAEIKNTGNSDAWIRVRITKEIKLAGEGEPDAELVELDLDLTNWTEAGDGFLYYNKVLKPGETTAPVFTTVTFKGEMGNMYQKSTATVDIAAQAVQTANNGSSATKAAGWPAA